MRVADTSGLTLMTVPNTSDAFKDNAAIACRAVLARVRVLPFIAFLMLVYARSSVGSAGGVEGAHNIWINKDASQDIENTQKKIINCTQKTARLIVAE